MREFISSENIGDWNGLEKLVADKANEILEGTIEECIQEGMSEREIENFIQEEIKNIDLQEIYDELIKIK